MHLETSLNEHHHRGKKVNCEMSPTTKQLEDQFMTCKWLIRMVGFGPLSIVGPLPNGLTGLYVPVTILTGMALQVDSLNHACSKDTFIFDKVTEVNFVEISADKVRKNVQQFLHTYLVFGKVAPRNSNKKWYWITCPTTTMKFMLQSFLEGAL